MYTLTQGALDSSRDLNFDDDCDQALAQVLATSFANGVGTMVEVSSGDAMNVLSACPERKLKLWKQTTPTRVSSSFYFLPDLMVQMPFGALLGP